MAIANWSWVRGASDVGTEGKATRVILVRKAGHAGLIERFRHDLNEAQFQAATAPDGANLILAGPGSGKTRVITYRVAHLIARGVPPESILLVTFTRRAAREMIGRLEGLIGNAATRVWSGTFHHIGNRLLRRKLTAERLGFAPNFSILDSEDQTDLIRLAMEDAGFNEAGVAAPRPVVVQRLLSLAFNTQTPINQLVHDRHGYLVPWITLIEQAAVFYGERKRNANCMDYDDLLGLWAKLLRDDPEERASQGRMFHQILVDEMQDTNAIQIGIVEAIAAAGAGNLTAVGDDAQSIYRFRGAHYENILEFPKRHPSCRIYRLETNYRSTPEIVAFTNNVIGHNTSGFGKQLVSCRGSGVKPVLIAAADPHEEAQVICQLILDERDKGVSLDAMAVLLRNNHDGVILQGELSARGIPFDVRGGLRFFEQKHVKDVLSYLRVVANPRDVLSWRRLFLLLPGIGNVKAAAITTHMTEAADPWSTLESALVMKLAPPKGRGAFAAFVADLRRVRSTEPQTHPALAIAAVMQGGYPEIVKTRYDAAENRLADIEQFIMLAGRYDSLDRLIADLMLAGDVYGVDNVEPGEADQERLTLSTIHQAKGLEWSRVFLPRLIEENFPNSRSVAEPDGLEEERRIFYVAVSRAQDELTMAFPRMLTLGFRGPVTFTRMSRFLEELDSNLYEVAAIEFETDPENLEWKGGSNDPWVADD